MNVNDPFSPDLFAGRVAWVVGGSGGIGFGIAAALSAHGADVVISGRRPARLERARAELGAGAGKVETVDVNVRDRRAVEQGAGRVLDAFGHLDVLVNAAGGNFYAPVADAPHRAAEAVLVTSLVGSFHLAQVAGRHMLDRRRGCMLFVTSAHPERGFPGCAPAGAAKAGVTSLVASLAREWAPYGVRVNAVGPGPVATEGLLGQVLATTPAGRDEALERVRAKVPLGRLGTPEDMGRAALFLCSDASAFVTGVTLVVDGGLTLPPLAASVPGEEVPQPATLP